MCSTATDLKGPLHIEVCFYWICGTFESKLSSLCHSAAIQMMAVVAMLYVSCTYICGQCIGCESRLLVFLFSSIIFSSSLLFLPLCQSFLPSVSVGVCQLRLPRHGGASPVCVSLMNWEPIPSLTHQVTREHRGERMRERERKREEGTWWERERRI